VRTFAVIALLLLSFVPAWGAGEIQALEKVARAYAIGQPGLQAYRVTVTTDKISQMFAQMTASLPADAPRPPQPEVVKYWSRAADKAVIRAEGENVFPYMQELVQRFSTQFALDLRSFLLPVARSGDRALLLQNAEVQGSENRIGEVRLLSLAIDFGKPVDLQGAFYGEGLDLPQKQIRRLAIDLDLDLEVVKRIEIVPVAGTAITVEVRHLAVKAGQLPEEILITAPDGSVDDRFETGFDLIEGFWLPVRQVRELHRGDRQERFEVAFSDYRINPELPDEVRALLD